MIAHKANDPDLVGYALLAMYEYMLKQDAIIEHQRNHIRRIEHEKDVAVISSSNNDVQLRYGTGDSLG